MVPELTRAPSVDETSRLRLTGHFLNPPAKLEFDLVFEPVDGVWQLFGISLNPTRAAPAQ